MSHILFTVRFCEGRYHGLDTEGRQEWPPSPARLFQALVAGTAKGAVIGKEDQEALAWLEQLEPPVIAVPAVRKGQRFSHFMPNNDLDTVGGDPARIGEIRTATKRFHPLIFDLATPLLYVWSFGHGAEHAERMCDIALRLYQLGRGVDMAWAVAEILDADKAEERLSAYPGIIYRPAKTGNGQGLAYPQSGSLKSLIARYDNSRTRFKAVIEAAPTKNEPSRLKVAGQTFSQPPKPKFHKVYYNSPPVRLLYELRDMTRSAGLTSWPLKETVRLVETLRNGAATKLKESLPNKADTVERVFGLRRDAAEADKASRVRIIPLPSIGHQHADHGIRRVLVEIPPDCHLASDDIAWAFSATEAIDRTTGEIRWMLVSAEEYGMLDHYGIGEDIEGGFRVWRTVTPMALPIPRPRGRKNGSERADIEQDAAAAVSQALRHAGLTLRPAAIRVQREPFEANGALAESFATGTRFAPARLWHVEITFAKPANGPLLTGDGRYLGLGLMKPVKQVMGAHAFVIVNGLMPRADTQAVARSLRRAVMALAQDRLGSKTTLPTFFSGHEADGSPARRGDRSHLAFAFDEPRQRLLIITPHLLEGRQPNQSERKYLDLLDSAVTELRVLFAGSEGLLKLEPQLIVDDDPLFAHAVTWITQTAYRPTRYSKRTTPEQAIIEDVELELSRRGFPFPMRIETTDVTSGPRGGLTAHVRLAFSTAVKGPLMIGKNSNFGGGLFVESR